MQIIPVLDTYAQTFSITLAGQSCAISLYQKSTGLYCDLSLNNASVCVGVLCQNLNRIVRAAYSGFVGDLLWQDTTGSLDPSSPGLGTRYLFCYLTAADVAAIAASQPSAGYGT